MFEEITLKIGTIFGLIIGTVMTIMIVSGFTECLIDEFNKIKDKQRAKISVRRRKLRGNHLQEKENFIN